MSSPSARTPVGLLTRTAVEVPDSWRKPLVQERIEGLVQPALPGGGAVERRHPERGGRREDGQRGEAGRALTDTGRQEPSKPPVAVRAEHDGVAAAVRGG